MPAALAPHLLFSLSLPETIHQAFIDYTFFCLNTSHFQAPPIKDQYCTSHWHDCCSRRDPTQGCHDLIFYLMTSKINIKCLSIPPPKKLQSWSRFWQIRVWCPSNSHCNCSHQNGLTSIFPDLYFLIKVIKKKSSNPEKFLFLRSCFPCRHTVSLQDCCFIIWKVGHYGGLGVCPMEAASVCISVAMVTARQTLWQKVHRPLNPVCRRLSGTVADLIHSYFLLFTRVKK